MNDEHLSELVERLGKAIDNLQQLRDQTIFDSEYDRLGGKIEGVQLALSYVHEQQRFAAKQAVQS